MDTDLAWEQWGARDPYYGVLTDPRFRAGAMTPLAKEEFFALGGQHVDHVLALCRQHLDATFEPRTVLDFGCGVGRLVVPFAQRAMHVVGLDVSPSMLSEARRNCDEHGLANVVLLLSDDTLSAVPGTYGLVHSSIVLQHIELARGRVLFALLVDKVHPGGCGAIHVTYGWDLHAQTFGLPPPVVAPPPPNAWQRLKSDMRRSLQAFHFFRPPEPTPEPDPAQQDPEMQMHYYNLSEMMFILHQAGVRRLFTEFTDHGGALGALLVFRREGPPI